MKAKWLSGFLIGALALTGAAYGQIRDVTFSVDMAVQIDLNNFDPDTMGVDVRGGFNGWGQTALSRVGATTVYAETVAIEGDEGDPVNYKFYFNGPDNWENAIPDRSFQLGPAGEPQVLDTVYFDNQGPLGDEVTADVTFSVNMAVQIDLGNFDQGTGEVQIRGPFNGWGGTALTQVGETTVYSATLSVTAPEGSAVPHKFYIVGFPVPDDGYESGDDRTFVMGEDGVPNVLDTVYFNNQGPVGPEVTADVTFSVNMGVRIAAGQFNPDTMGVDVRGDFNDWGTTALAREGATTIYSATISVTAPEDSAVEYKFFYDSGEENWEDDPNRSFIMGEDGVPQVLDTVYFNNEEPAGGLDLSGTWNPATTGDYEFTVTRSDPGIGDVINLDSDNLLAATVPATVTFAAGEDEATFNVTIVSLENGDVTITAEDPVSGDMAEYTMRMPGMEIDGPWQVYVMGPVNYTLRRVYNISGTVNLSSSDPGVMTVPATATFAGDDVETTFQATAVGFGATTLTATDPANGIFAQFNASVEPPALEVFGPQMVWTGSSPTFTVVRYGPVGDVVNLSSTDDAVLQVPATVTFGFEEDTATFQAQALSEGMATIGAQNDDANADPWPVSVLDPPVFVAYDDASLYDGGEWTPTPVHVTGFSDWTVELSPEIENSFRGVFIGESAIVAINEAGVAFGLYANYFDSDPDPRPEVKLFRSFPGPMLPGQVFSVDVGYDWSSGAKGFRLWGSWEDAFYERFELFNSGNNTWSYKLDGDDDTITVVWDGYIEGGFKGTVQAVCTAPNTFDFGFQRAGGEWVWVEDVVLPGTIDTIEFYNWNGGTGDAENFYFNRMWLTEADDPDPALEFIAGVWDVTATGMYEYTLRRVGAVEDEITLTSDNPATLWVPPSVTFVVGEDTVSFMAEVLALDQGDATIEAWDPVSGAMAEFVVRPREEEPGIVYLVYDPATRGMSFTAPADHTFSSLEWADLALAADRDGFDFAPIPETLYTIVNGTAIIHTDEVGSPRRMVIRAHIRPIL